LFTRREWSLPWTDIGGGVVVDGNGG